MGASIRPFAWDPHIVVWAVLATVGTLVVLGHRRLLRSSEHPIRWPRRQQVAFGAAMATAAVALTWPLADLAAHWSLTALVIQRLLLVLAVSSMLLLGLPYDVLQWITRPALVDTVLTRLQRPPAAIITVTMLLVGSMAPPLVRAQAEWPAVRAALYIVMVATGLVLWIPVLGRVPGILRLGPAVRFGYLVAQAVVPAFLSFVYIFSTRPLYSVFAHSHQAIGLRSLTDQQIAGFVSKLTMLIVLLSVGGVVLARAPGGDDDLGVKDPLVWADVERQFERADRRSRRRKVRGGGLPGHSGTPPGTPPGHRGVPPPGYPGPTPPGSVLPDRADHPLRGGDPSAPDSPDGS